jgi:hypothetical protein
MSVCDENEMGAETAKKKKKKKKLIMFFFTRSDPASIAEARRRRNLGPVTAMASLGDNFYYFGVKSRKDRLFDDVYGTSFGTGCTSKLNFWSIAGNHCYRGSVSALLQRDVIVSAQREAKKGGAGGKAGQTPKSPRGSGGGKSHDQDGTVDISSANVAIARRHGWRMPARSYVVQLPTGRIIDALGGPRDPAPIVDGLAAAGPRARGRVETNAPLGVRLIFIDTNPLVCLPVQAGPRSRECEVMHSLDSANETEEVIAWLRRVAKEAHDDPDTHWFAVLGHHPVASNVRRDCTRLQAALLPHLRMFARSSKFAGYFAGHDHALQHIRRAGVDNFAVGGGGGPLQPVRRDARAHDTKPWTPRAGAPREQAPFSQRETVFTMPGFGFMELRATRSSWHSLIRNADGDVVHRFTKRRRVRAKGGKGKNGNKDGKRDDKRDDKRDKKTKDNRRTPAAAVDLGSRGKAAKTRASTTHEDSELA